MAEMQQESLPKLLWYTYDMKQQKKNISRIRE